jgi:hypothetical protein
LNIFRNHDLISNSADFGESLNLYLSRATEHQGRCFWPIKCPVESAELPSAWPTPPLTKDIASPLQAVDKLWDLRSWWASIPD